MKTDHYADYDDTKRKHFHFSDKVRVRSTHKATSANGDDRALR